MDTEFSNPSDAILLSGESSSYNLFSHYRTGYGIGGSIGAVFCRNWRLEVEVYFRNFNGKGVAVTQDTEFAAILACCGDGCPLTVMFNPSTHYRSFSLMVNGFYDFCLCNSFSWYIGGGIGPSG